MIRTAHERRPDFVAVVDRLDSEDKQAVYAEFDIRK